MGNFGVFASRLHSNSKSLEEFDTALRVVRERPSLAKSSETLRIIEKLLNVVEPIARNIDSRLSESTAINDQSVADIIKSRHERDWPEYRIGILRLYSKLSSDEFSLSRNDIRLLEDIADALDAECADLFKRMSEKS